MIASALFSVGGRRSLNGWSARLAKFWAAVVAVWVVYAAAFAILDSWLVVAVFLSAMLPLVFLTVGPTPSASQDGRPPVLDWLLSATSILCGIYLYINAGIIVSRIPLFNPLPTLDILVGTALFILTMEVVRRTTGLGLTFVVLLFVGYVFLGDHLGGLLGHGPIGYLHFLELSVYTTDGILGLPLRVAATYAFLFVMFGTFLARAGGSEFFFNVAAAISGRRPGGPAKIAVISSGIYGMLSGSPTADVVTTGGVTIPMMKRLGYPAHLAGAFEVAASAGGSLLPPVMGSAAFIMAEYTGIEYRDIAIAAIVPALLYYVSVYGQVNYRSLKMGLRGMSKEDVPKLRPTLREGGLFFIPLAALIVALFLGYSPTFVALIGSVSIVLTSMVRRRTRLGPIRLYESLAETSLRMAPLTGACAAAGLVIGSIMATGLALKFSALVVIMTGGNLFLVLLVAGAITILLGMGMPTPSAYILAAVLLGPLLTKQYNVPLLSAHLFLLYYSVLSAITPPVAVAAYAASPIADANPLYIAALAVRLALAAFIVPFAFVYSPSLLLSGNVFNIVVAIGSAMAGVWIIAISIEGYFRGPLPWWNRLLSFGAGLCLVAPTLITLAVGLVMLVVAFIPKATRQVETSPPSLSPSPGKGDGWS